MSRGRAFGSVEIVFENVKKRVAGLRPSRYERESFVGSGSRRRGSMREPATEWIICLKLNRGGWPSP